MLTKTQQERKQEIYEDIIRRRGPLNPLTASQKKHLKKVAKKRMKSEERKAKQLKEQAESGRLIKESHNGGDYSPEFTEKAAAWLLSEITDRLGLEPDSFLLFFRSRRPKYIELLLKWSPDLQRDYRFDFFKGIIEEYWNQGGVLEYAKNNLERTGGII